MNAILGMVNLGLQKTISRETKDFLQTARQSADLLLALLNDLLDYAKIESGKLELESAPFSLRTSVGSDDARTSMYRTSGKGLLLLVSDGRRDAGCAGGRPGADCVKSF